jgi:hypothetical protein
MNITNDIKPVTYFKSKAAALLKLISQGENDVRDGNVKSQEEVFKDIENFLREKI